jgi:hypothetical protein
MPPTPPANDPDFRSRNLPGVSAGERAGMLPGMAFIGIYMLLLAMLNAFAAIHGVYGTSLARYGILALCTIAVLGVFGFLKLLRWGWSIVVAGFILLATGDLYLYTHTHVGFLILRALFSIVFFLYLVRPEVRERVH